MPASPLIRTRLPRPPCAAVRRLRRRASSRSRPTSGGVVGDGDRTSMRDLADVEQTAEHEAESAASPAYTQDGSCQAERDRRKASSASPSAPRLPSKGPRLRRPPDGEPCGGKAGPRGGTGSTVAMLVRRTNLPSSWTQASEPTAERIRSAILAGCDTTIE